MYVFNLVVVTADADKELKANGKYTHCLNCLVGIVCEVWLIIFIGLSCIINGLFLHTDYVVLKRGSVMFCCQSLIKELKVKAFTK